MSASSIQIKISWLHFTSSILDAYTYYHFQNIDNHEGVGP